MARLYANENFPREVTMGLRDRGHDVLTVQEAGNAGQAVPDTEVLRFATREGRAVLTINRRDFIHLHQRDSGHAGIIVCTQDPDTVGQAERVDLAIASVAPTLAGQLLRVNRPQS